VKKVLYCAMEYGEFEDLVKKEYGQDYEFVPDIECGNDSDHSYSIEKEELDSWDAKSIEEFKSTGKYSFMARRLLQDLVNNDKLPEGDFLITVSW